MKILNLHDSEMLDYFVQGLKLFLFEQVIKQAIKIFEDAANLAKCSSLAQ